MLSTVESHVVSMGALFRRSGGRASRLGKSTDSLPRGPQIQMEVAFDNAGGPGGPWSTLVDPTQWMLIGCFFG